MKSIYNFLESYLAESFFDSIEDDIYSDNDTMSIISNSVIKSILDKLISDLTQSDSYIICTYDLENKEFNIKGKYDQYFITVSLLLNIIDGLYNNSIEGFTIKLYIKYSIGIMSENSFPAHLDMHNYPIEIIDDDTHVLRNVRITFTHILFKNLNLKSDVRVELAECPMTYSDTISILSNTVTLYKCSDMKNLKFLNNVTKLITIIAGEYSNYPKDFQGITAKTLITDVTHIPVKKMKPFLKFNNIPDNVIFKLTTTLDRSYYISLIDIIPKNFQYKFAGYTYKWDELSEPLIPITDFTSPCKYNIILGQLINSN